MKTPSISEAEWQVMKILWIKGKSTANDIVDALASGTSNAHPKTVKTLINRLLKKGAVGFEQVSRTYIYHPMVEETQCIQAESSSFLKRFFGGNLEPMFTHFVEQTEMSKAEISELKRILERKDKR